MPLKRFFTSCLLFLAGMTIVSAQPFTLEGTVVDKMSGNAVAYAAVYLPDLARGVSADENGRFRIAGVPGICQRVTVTRTGYRPFVISACRAPGDTIVRVTIAMEAGGNERDEVVIIGTQTGAQERSATTVTSIPQREMRARGAMSISDGVSKLPGITQLSTGAGISKPVIRGLYGNRIQTVTLGMRFDNQQWQDEHGLGLQDIGVERVEVIKGPASLMYGSEAMGGVINIIEEKPANVDSVNGDVSLRAFSNTYGAGLDAGVLATKKNISWRVRLGAESHADYTDGNGERVDNSRFDGYVGKASLGIRRKNWVCTNNYLFSKSDFGFIMDSATVLDGGPRLSRDFKLPHHTVYINLFTSQNTFFAGSGDIWRVIGGMHINRRMEDEGGGGISLDMQLITGALHVQHEHAFNPKWSLTSGLQSQYQDNTNFGWRKIVPDAVLAEASLYTYARFAGERSTAEGGLRYDLRHITTSETGGINSGPYAIPLVSKLYNTVNGSLGTAINITSRFYFKANVTSGYRTPNLAELSSNGVHEGTLRYEIGDAAMKIEQNFCAEGGFGYRSEHFNFFVTAYNDRFLDYIYLNPTSGEYFGFRIYRYVQTNATLQGGEATIDWSPAKASWLDLSAAYSTVRATTDAGDYLPFIPADRLDGTVRVSLKDRGSWSELSVFGSTHYYFAQDRPAQFETATAAYTLVDAGLGASVALKGGRQLHFDVSCTNLLNTVYYDHLSRFKEFNLYNIGRNVCLNVNYKW